MIFPELNLAQFSARYNSEEACLEAIFEYRWPRGFTCPSCGHGHGYRLSKPRTMQCASCRKQVSITAGTIFHRSKIPLVKWFLAVYLFSHDKGGCSALRMSKELGVRYTTAWLMLQKMRICMGERDAKLTLAGSIELDEAYVGGRSKNKSRGLSPFHGKVEVLVMVESEGTSAGNVVMKAMSGSRIEFLREVFAQKLESDPPGQYVRADALGQHHMVLGLGHRLKMTKMTHDELNREMVCVSLAISHLKRFFKGTYHHFCKIHIQRYLDEFCYRWNRRHLEKQIASRLLKACVLHRKVFAKQIRASAKPA